LLFAEQEDEIVVELDEILVELDGLNGIN